MKRREKRKEGEARESVRSTEWKGKKAKERIGKDGKREG